MSKIPLNPWPKHYRNTNFLIPTHWELNFQHMTSRQTQSVFNNSHLRILQSHQKVSILFLLHWFLDQIFPFSFCFWFVCRFFISDSSFQLLFCLCCFWAPEMLFLEMIIRAKTTSSTPILCSVIFLGPSLLSTMPYWSVFFFYFCLNSGRVTVLHPHFREEIESMPLHSEKSCLSAVYFSVLLFHIDFISPFILLNSPSLIFI